jgi:hypothetical protein
MSNPPAKHLMLPEKNAIRYSSGSLFSIVMISLRPSTYVKGKTAEKLVEDCEKLI